MKSYASLESPSWIRYCKRSNLQLAKLRAAGGVSQCGRATPKNWITRLRRLRNTIVREHHSILTGLIGPVSTKKASSPKRPSSMRL